MFAKIHFKKKPVCIYTEFFVNKIYQYIVKLTLIHILQHPDYIQVISRYISSCESYTTTRQSRDGLAKEAKSDDLCYQPSFSDAIRLQAKGVLLNGGLR